MVNFLLVTTLKIVNKCIYIIKNKVLIVLFLTYSPYYKPVVVFNLEP